MSALVPKVTRELTKMRRTPILKIDKRGFRNMYYERIDFHIEFSPSANEFFENVLLSASRQCAGLTMINKCGRGS